MKTTAKAAPKKKVIKKATKAKVTTKAAPKKIPEWKRLFNESWRIVREHRTLGPQTITSTPFNHVTLNEGVFKKYRVRLRFQTSPYGKYPATYIVSVFRGKSTKELIELHHIDGLLTGTEDWIPKVLADFGDTGFDPFGKDKR